MAKTVATITDTPALRSTGGGRSIARDTNGRLYVAYVKKPSGYTYLQLHIAYSDDGGLTWTEEQVNTSDIRNEFYPAIATDSANKVHISYSRYDPTEQGYGVFYKQRSAAGVWSSKETVALGGLNCDHYESALAVDSSDAVHVVWYGEQVFVIGHRYDIGYRKRTTSWAAIEWVTSVSNNDSQYFPSIAIDSNDYIHVIWEGKGWGTNTTVRNIQYRKRTTSWQTQEAITDSASRQGGVGIAIDSSDYIHAVWHGLGWGTNTTKYNIQYRQRTDAWQTQEAVTDETRSRYSPTIAIDSGSAIHVAWYSDEAYPSYDDIHTRSRNASWGTKVDVTSAVYPLGNQTQPSLLWALHPSSNIISGYLLVWENYQASILITSEPDISTTGKGSLKQQMVKKLLV